MELFYTKEIEGNSLCLRGDEASHCARVLRKREGSEIFVIDGIGGLYRCEITSIQKAGVEAVIKERLKGQGESAYFLTMAVCPTKNMERFEWFVEKATEFGINEIVPIVSGHSIRTTVKKERLEAIVLSATKQSLKAYLPKVEEPVSVKSFLGDASRTQDSSYDLKLIAHCENGEKISIRQALLKLLSEHKGKKFTPRILVLIGPEGDFTKEEIEMAQKAGFKAITLGNSRLRVETAALAAVSEVYFGVQK